MTDERFAFLGFGELAAALAATLAAAGVDRPVAFSRPRPGIRERIESAGVGAVDTLAAATAEAGCVFACVPGAVAEEVARDAAASLRPGALYVDLATSPPQAKERAASAVAAARADYVDAAVLGTVVTSGGGVPILAAGSGAQRLAALVTPLGMTVTAIDAPPGAATRIKLLRSVYMKGRDALIAEMMLSARRHGVEDVVAASIAGPGEEVPFAQLAERVLASLALHAERRADELEDSRQVVEAAGVEPAATDGSIRRLRALGDLEMPPAASGERLTAAQVLDILERLDAR
jgi:3-hydroxyisobutyrate dehydrogenase-like beta-hydroxyacid dehydrogenase